MRGRKTGSTFRVDKWQLSGICRQIQNLYKSFQNCYQFTSKAEYKTVIATTQSKALYKIH